MSLSSTYPSEPIEPSSAEPPALSTSGSKSRFLTGLPSRRDPDFAPFVAAAVLLVLLFVQFALPSPALEPPYGGLALRLARPVEPTPLPDRPAVLSANVFSPDRRPVSAASGSVAPPMAGADAAPAVPAGLDAYAVLGVGSAGRATSALLRGPGGVRTVRPGAVVAGWRVAAISRDSVVFSRGGARRVLQVGAGAASTTDVDAIDEEPVDNTSEAEEAEEAQ